MVIYVCFFFLYTKGAECTYLYLKIKLKCSPKGSRNFQKFRETDLKIFTTINSLNFNEYLQYSNPFSKSVHIHQILFLQQSYEIDYKYIAHRFSRLNNLPNII